MKKKSYVSSILILVIGIVLAVYAMNQYKHDNTTPTLVDKAWVWEKTEYNDERVVKPQIANKFRITFSEDGRFSAETDCNRVGGMYEVQEGRLLFKEIYSTKMYCEGSQETEFLKMLEHTSGYLFTTEGKLILELKFDSGTVTLF